jgi:hypothetical protein
MMDKPNLESQQDQFSQAKGVNVTDAGPDNTEQQTPPADGSSLVPAANGPGAGAMTCTVEDVVNAFPPVFRDLLATELQYISSTRTVVSDLFKEQIDGEKDILKKLTPPAAGAAAPAPNGSQGDQQDEAQLWYKRLVRCMAQEETDLKAQLQAVEGDVKAKAAQAGAFRQDVEDANKLAHPSPAEVAAAQAAVKTAQDNLQRATDDGSQLRIARYTQEKAAADAALAALTQKPEDSQAQLQSAVKSWRTARKRLIDLKGGNQDASWEKLSIQLKQVQKLSEYVKQYQKELVNYYFSQQKSSAQKQS